MRHLLTNMSEAKMESKMSARNLTPHLLEIEHLLSNSARLVHGDVVYWIDLDQNRAKHFGDEQWHNPVRLVRTPQWHPEATNLDTFPHCRHETTTL